MKTLDLVFLWHMHQPDYRDHGAASRVGAGDTAAGEFVLPWVYLHAMKDYADMAAHLERHPQIRCVVNFVPVLLDQIEDYVQQFASGEFRDPLLRMLGTRDLEHISEADRHLLLATCFRSNHVTMLAPFPRYQRLHDLYLLAAHEHPAASRYFSGAYFSDLVTWYHLAWTGESERRRNPLLATLMSQGEGYDADDRQRLLTSIGELITGLIPRWRALAARGQVELSTTPQTHPLSPLMLDFRAARESLPEAPLPFNAAYPGGRSRVIAQIEAARSSHARRFGAPPVGMWPAEGAVSEDFVKHLAAAGCRWIASGEGVLRNSLTASRMTDPAAAYHPWQLEKAPGLTLYFRDERLSDLIGFDYAKWHGRDAAQHLVNQLEAILDAAGENATPVVSIILDGENAWEHYPYNGYYFFDDLYGLLAEHPRIRSTTYGDLMTRARPPAAVLPHLTAGSWVYGTLSTWIGDEAKNRGWDLLCEAKQSCDRVLASGRLDAAQIAAVEAQLAICESSDWFWWFGDYNPSAAVASFDSLYRRNLERLYRLLQLQPPSQLDTPICAGSATAESGSMRRATVS
ncbi:MAG: glycoside hydrolase [Rhodocyclales bacterium RIFCSPLOWO2_02_FULL_63_24]|nr:MAG: glycoside hydrolase [Rhodocyclales bacterium GWA2_65_19]OHC68394.1 MAG: glycoside hydrolase [Rhodocyclales bacterium RIFCSPLOWO2_02_FULL_63_24]